MRITYTAKRGLSAGHVAGTSYDIETDAHVIDPSRKVGKTVNTSLDGTPETVLGHIHRRYNILTDYITADELQFWDELVDSTEATESIDIDLYGTLAVPVNLVAARVVNSAKPKRVSGMLYQMRFEVEII